MEFGYIIVAALVVASIGIIVYDHFKYGHNYYSLPLIVLRVNNERVRNTLKASGISLCWCATSLKNNSLMCYDGFSVCGFNENIDHTIFRARKKKVKVIDCGVSVKKFIYEIQNLKK